jgi:hypothetical protein
MEQHDGAMRARPCRQAQQRVKLAGPAGGLLGGMGGDAQRDLPGGAGRKRGDEGEQERKEEKEPAHPPTGAPRMAPRQRQARP